MLVKDLQEFLSKFTEADATGTRQGNAISNAVIFVEQNGYLHEIKRMEVHDHAVPIVGHGGHTAHRLVLKTVKDLHLFYPRSLKMTTEVNPKSTWVQKLNYIKNLRKLPHELSGIGLKTLAFLACLICWGTIILATFSLSN